MILQGDGRISKRRAGIDNKVGQIKQCLTTRVPGLPAFRFRRRSEYDDFHAALLRLKRNVNIHVVDAGVRKYPHVIPCINVVTIHDFNTVPYLSFEEEKLMHSHFTCDPREES